MQLKPNTSLSSLSGKFKGDSPSSPTNSSDATARKEEYEEEEEEEEEEEDIEDDEEDIEDDEEDMNDDDDDENEDDDDENEEDNMGKKKIKKNSNKKSGGDKGEGKMDVLETLLTLKTAMVQKSKNNNNGNGMATMMMMMNNNNNMANRSEENVIDNNKGKLKRGRKLKVKTTNDIESERLQRKNNERNRRRLMGEYFKELSEALGGSFLEADRIAVLREAVKFVKANTNGSHQNNNQNQNNIIYNNTNVTQYMLSNKQ